MRKLLLGVLLSVCATAFAGDMPAVKKLDNGVYWSLVARSFIYYVDTEAQLCFVADSRSSALALIPCKNLKKRQEWSQIITWE